MILQFLACFLRGNELFFQEGYFGRVVLFLKILNLFLYSFILLLKLANAFVISLDLFILAFDGLFQFVHLDVRLF